LVAGDTAVCLEASSLLGATLVTCSLKEGLGRSAAITKSPEATAALISESVKRALEAAASSKSPVLKMEAPYEAELTFHSTAQADAAGLVPGSERISGRTMVFTTEDVFELRRWYASSIDCAALVGY
jgi:D-amino peptidase